MITRVLFTLTLVLIACEASAQVLYLSPYEGDGTEANPFRATGGLPGHTCKSLRASETQQAGYGLCSGPSVPIRAGVIDLSNKRAVGKGDRDKIFNERGLAVTASTFDGLISELVDSQSVSLGRKNGRQRIVVAGQDVWSRPAPLSSYLPDIWRFVKDLVSTPVAWAAATITETWTCADDSTPSYVCDHTWVRSNGTTAQVLTNSIRNVNSVGSNTLYADTALDSTDMQHTLTVVDIDRGTATNVGGGPGIRNPGTGTGTYVYCVARDAASDEIELGHVVAGSLTTDATVSATIANGDTITTVGVGDQVSCKHNGVTVIWPITENTGSGNVNIAIRFSGSGTATTTLVALDDSHAEFATVPPPTRRRMVLR